MKIVIDISEDHFLDCKYWLNEGVANFAETIIANGIPLPKEHGRLKDIDEVERRLDLEKPDNAIAKALKTIIESVPTIVEADKAESEE